MSAVRVLHILPSISGYGAERLTVELLRRLPSSSVDAALLTVYEPPANESAALPFPLFHASRKGRKDRLFLFNLVREIRRYGPDIVHTHTHVGKYWGRTAAIMAGVRRIVHTEHNPCDFRRTPAERTADWLLDRATSRVVTFFRDQGRRLTELEHLPQNKLVVIPNGLVFADPVNDRRAARGRLGVTDSEFAIMLIGRMEYQKNHVLALRAFSMLSRRIHPRAILLFAGAGENEVMLRGLATALKVDDRVRFLGYRNDVPALLPGADLVLMTSWFEGMPLALLEAMIAGVPIVTTPWLGAANMLGDGRYGFLSSDFEPLHVAAEIERAITRPNIRRSVAERARAHVRDQYHMDRMVDAYRDMYLQLYKAAS